VVILGLCATVVMMTVDPAAPDKPATDRSESRTAPARTDETAGQVQDVSVDAGRRPATHVPRRAWAATATTSQRAWAATARTSRQAARATATGVRRAWATTARTSRRAARATAATSRTAWAGTIAATRRASAVVATGARGASAATAKTSRRAAHATAVAARRASTATAIATRRVGTTAGPVLHRGGATIARYARTAAAVAARAVRTVGVAVVALAAGVAAAWRAAWRSSRRAGSTATRAGAGAATAGHRLADSAGATGHRLREGIANDARTVAATASAAGRRLKPDPPLATGEHPVVIPPDYAAATAARASTAKRANGEGGHPDRVRSNGQGGQRSGNAHPTAPAASAEVASAESAAVTTTARHDRPRRASLDGGNGSRSVDTAAVAAAPATHPSDTEPIVGRTDGAVPLRPNGSRSPEPRGSGDRAERVVADTAAATAVAEHSPARVPRTDGVVVALRTPFLVRVRAACGLLTLITLLGIATAAMVVGLLIAGAALLNSV
jgi:trimeric autotransporter adhesin